MDFKQHFLYQADYQHWANDMLFNALDRLDEEARSRPLRLFYGSIHNSVDHLAHFQRKWSARLKGESPSLRYAGIEQPDWHELKNSLRREIRALQHWMERQPPEFFDARLDFRRTSSQEPSSIWVRDAFTHIFTYGALERGHISAAASALGAPFPDMTYYSYRLEMGDHLQHLRTADSGMAAGDA